MKFRVNCWSKMFILDYRKSPPRCSCKYYFKDTEKEWKWSELLRGPFGKIASSFEKNAFKVFIYAIGVLFSQRVFYSFSTLFCKTRIMKMSFHIQIFFLVLLSRRFYARTWSFTAPVESRMACFPVCWEQSTIVSELIANTNIFTSNF